MENLLHFDDVNTTNIFPLVHVLMYVEVQVGASQMGSCHQELENILPLHLKNI